MSRAFNFEGPVFTFLSRLADLFWLNLLFIVCCIPVITIGAATTALYYVTLKMAKDEEGYITRSYFKSFKENFKQATVIWIGFLVVGMIMITDLRIVNGGNTAEILGSPALGNVIMVAVFLMGIVILMVGTYIFPILAQFDNTIKNTAKNAFLISIRHLPYTIAMLVITAIPVVLIWFFPALFILVLIMFSATAYFNSKLFNKIFVLYMPKEDSSSDPAEDINGEG
ncbi:MAG: YesL family protein [Lachnospiraceae bacterium]|nr:YesL family protein [Lachnospiraceae bacterium]MBR1450989.1 YesL family protein [Lachnospiraceae bacterium]